MLFILLLEFSIVNSSLILYLFLLDLLLELRPDHQAPVHTDSLTEYRSKLKIIRTTNGAEIRQQETVADHVVEQRISHFLMGLAIIGTMTGPLLVVLNLIPRALFAGVFFVVGVSSPIDHLLIPWT